MEEAKVCIVTPIHNGLSQTLRFLASVERSRYRNLETIIVDDGSTDGSSKEIARKFPETIVLQGDGDLWWAAATNLGVQEALSRGAQYIFTVNNDVVMTEDTISASVACHMREGPALVGSTVYFLEDPDKIWFSGARFDRRTGDIELQNDAIVCPDGIRETHMLTGMGMLIPSDAFAHVGLFDQKVFPQYLADSDFSLRAAKQGYRLLVTSQSWIYNEVSSAWSVRQMDRPTVRFLIQMLFAKRSAYWVVARVRFYRRHWGKGKSRALLRLYSTAFGKFVARSTRHRHKRHKARM